MSDQTARYWRADGGYQNAPPTPGLSTASIVCTVRYWRADGGYQDVFAPPQAAPMANPQMMFCYPSYLPYWPQAQGGYIQGPIGIGGLYSPPPPYASPVPPAQVPLPPCPPVECKKEEEKKPGNLYAPPALPHGANYMFDKGENHTMLHIFNKAAPVWTEKYRNEKL